MWIVTKASNGVKRWIKFNSDENSSEKLDCSKINRYTLYTNGRYVKSIVGLEKKPGVIYEAIDYNTFSKKATIVPDGYVKNILTEKEIKNSFCDKNKKRLRKNNSFFKQIKKETSGYKKYIIEDKFGIIFIVYVHKNDIRLYKRYDSKIPCDFYTTEKDYLQSMKENDMEWMYIILEKNSSEYFFEWYSKTIS